MTDFSAGAIGEQQWQLPVGITLAATPLGNLGDASPRLCAALASAEVIAAEDTRRTRQLAAALGVTLQAAIVSNFDHNELNRAQSLVAAARTKRVLVVSDAGMPSVSDPGFPVVAAAHEAGVPVTCIPGPSAVPTALALSGLPVGRFIFDGFAPRKPNARQEWLESLLQEQRAVCFFESPHRLADCLEQAAQVLGPERPAAVCRELTKHFEEVKRGGLGELVAWAQQGVKGEISVVIAGVAELPPAAVVTVAQAAQQAVELAAAEGLRLKDAAGVVAKAAGLRKNEVFAQAVQLQQ